MELKKFHRYLIAHKDAAAAQIQDIKVKDITESSFKIKFNDHEEWILKPVFYTKYQIFEDLGYDPSQPNESTISHTEGKTLLFD